MRALFTAAELVTSPEARRNPKHKAAVGTGRCTIINYVDYRYLYSVYAYMRVSEYRYHKDK